MRISQAIRAAARDAPRTAIDGFLAAESDVESQGAFETDLRVAHLIGQCAHESLRFTRVIESLSYSSADRLLAVFGRRFDDAAHAGRFVRQPERLANHVYANRNGNGPPESGDGYRYRGRGYLQLTGRANYRQFGQRVGLDLVSHPELAAQPEHAWRIAAAYLASRKRQGRTAFEWADDNNVELVTLIVNGGQHGLEDRRARTARALDALRGVTELPTLRAGDEGDRVLILQRALAARGFAPGPLDGDFGTGTGDAVRAFQRAQKIRADGIVGRDTWDALKPLPQ